MSSFLGPTFGYTDPNNDNLSWDENEVCLDDLRDRYQNTKTDLLLAVNTSALRISVGDNDTPIELSPEEIYVETSRSESPSTCPEENTTVEGIASDIMGERPADDNDKNAANTAIEELDDEDEDEDVLHALFAEMLELEVDDCEDDDDADVSRIRSRLKGDIRHD
jgi:hypothetical protein